MVAAAAMAALPAAFAGGAGYRMIRSGKPMIDRLRKRPEFIRLRDGARYRTRAFLIQAKARQCAESGGNEEIVERGAARFGFTVTKKTGNAVERNRIRRRLKEALRQVDGKYLASGVDYVLIGNRPALNETMGSMVMELTRGLDHVNRKTAEPARSRNGSGKRQAERQLTRRSQSGTSA